MSDISQESEQAIKKFLSEWWAMLRWQIQEMSPDVQLPLATEETLYHSVLGTNLQHIAAAAEGALKRTKASARDILENIRQIDEQLWLRPGMCSSHQPPAEWWQSPIGWLCLQARVWAHDDKLITLTEASQMTGQSLSSLSQLVSRQKLNEYQDPREPNPQRRRRLLKSELARLMKKY